MFPLKANEPYIKETGERSTLGAMMGSGSDIPEHSVSDEGKILSVNDQGNLEWKTPTTELPEYSATDAGSVLGVDEDGLLEWKEQTTGAKIYYKDFNTSFNTSKAIGDTGFYIHYVNTSLGKDYFNISGYSIIGSMLKEDYTGYHTLGGIPLAANGSGNYVQPVCINTLSDNSGATKIRVFYVKSSDIEQLT